MDNTIDILFKFKEHLKVLHRSPATIKAYINNAKNFLYAAEEADIRRFTTSMIETWIAGLYDYRTKNGNPYTTSTLCMKIRSVKRFFEYLELSNLIFIDPAENIREPGKKKNPPKNILTVKEANKILDQPNLGTRMGIRDRTILEVFYSTGIRLNELCCLTIYDADLQGGVMRVKGKGRKDRVVPVGKHALKLLREYIAKVRPHYTKKNRKSRQLFVNHSGNPVTIHTVENMVRKHVKTAKIKKHVTPHTFRHTFASALVKNGADIRAVQKMLGHADLNTTQIYIRSFGLDLKKVHTRTHPREKDRQDLRSIKPQIKRRIPKNE